MGTEEFTLKTQARSSALVSLQSPPEQASHPTAEIFQQTIRANYAILPPAPKSNFLAKGLRPLKSPGSQESEC
jgi:hypothetical protein